MTDGAEKEVERPPAEKKDEGIPTDDKETEKEEVVSEDRTSAEKMEVEGKTVPASKEAQVDSKLEKQQVHSTQRRKLAIDLTSSNGVSSKTVPSRSSPIPSVRLQPSHSPLRSSGSPVFNPLHPRGTPGYHLPSSPVASLASSEFVSPSRSISAEGLQELRRQVTEQLGQEAEVCELRYVRTICTVIEERIISSELVENGVVVPGSGKCWPVS